MRAPGEKPPKKYTTQEMKIKLEPSDDDGAPAGTYQAGRDVLAELQEEARQEGERAKHIGYAQHTLEEKRRVQDLKRLEAGRRQLGGFTGEDQLEKLQAQLREEVTTDTKRHAKPELREIELRPEDFQLVDVEGEERARGYAQAKDAIPPPIPYDAYSDLAKREELVRLQEEYGKVTAELKSIGVKILKKEVKSTDNLPLMRQQVILKNKIRELEAAIKGEPTMADKIAAARAKKIEEMKTRQQSPIAAEPTKATKPPEVHEVYGGKGYSVPIGGIGLGNVAGAMDRGGGVLRHYTGGKSSETENAPERTNEEALFDLDQDLIDPNKNVKFFGHDKDWAGQDSTAEIPAEKLLQKFFKSESKIYLDDKYVATILTDKILVHALDVENWDGKNLSVLRRIVGEISLENSDKLADSKKKKGFFGRFFKTDEEKRLETQTQALDRFAEALTARKEDGGSSPQTKRLLRTMMKR